LRDRLSFYSPAHSVNLQTSEQARADLKVMQQQGLPMVAISADRLDGTIQLRVHSHGESQDWFVGNHAYTVLAYNMQTDMVTVRNPWADHPEPDGVFTISTSDFVSAYPILALANR
jgi:phenylalanyl-tRNA synthetase beta subunit